MSTEDNQEVTIKNVAYVPDITRNLFHPRSLLTSDGETATVTKDGLVHSRLGSIGFNDDAYVKLKQIYHESDSS